MEDASPVLWRPSDDGGWVLEHPAHSHAWRAFGLPPPKHEGWWRDITGGWCAEVAQGNYGHLANKATWIYASDVKLLPSLKWGKSAARREVEQLSKKQRSATPIQFRDLLLSIARSAISSPPVPQSQDSPSKAT